MSVLKLRSDAFSETNAAKPTVAAGAGAGTGPTGLANTGRDSFGTATVTAGTSPGAGTLFTVTYANAYTVAPDAVIVSPADSATAAVGGFYASATTTVLTIGTHGTPAGTMKLNYVLVGGV
jgi:hypothetical protein